MIVVETWTNNMLIGYGKTKILLPSSQDPMLLFYPVSNKHKDPVAFYSYVLAIFASSDKN